MDQKSVKSSRGKEKAKHFGDLDSSRFSITGRGKGKTDTSSQDAVYSVVTHMERTLFIVDLSKLEGERDTLAGALVMYRPQADFLKSHYEQRCSQVIGLSLCMKNLTGKYPKFLHMKSIGFAIQGFGRTYIMGLSSRPDEPGSCAVDYLQSICNQFRFYYHSADTVMQSSQGDWEVFTTAMSSIFNRIMNYTTANQHSVPAMLKPLPYLAAAKKNQQTYMLSMRVLRTCQKYSPIIAGSIMNNSKLVVSQFPPRLMEMLVLIGAGGLELNQRSILEENIAPGKVWVLEIFLTREEARLARDQRQDLTALQATYASMDVNPNLTSSTLHWRFQSSVNSSKSSTENIKTRKSWRRKSHRNDPGSSRRSATSAGTGSPNSQLATPKPKSNSLNSEEALMFSPGLSSVSFNNNLVSNKNTKQQKESTPITKAPHLPPRPPPHQHSRLPPRPPLSPGGNNTGNETDDLYLDAVDDVDPMAAIGPEMLRLFSRSTSHPNNNEGEGPSVGAEVDNLKGFSDSPGSAQIPVVGRVSEVESQVNNNTGSTSSEGFATPSPTPPRMSSMASSQLLLQVDSSGGGGGALDMTSSFKTACDLSLHTTDEEGERGADVAAQDSAGLKATPTDNREASSVEKQGTHLTTPTANGEGSSQLTTPTAEKQGTDRPLPSLPPQMNTRNFSESDDDFIDFHHLDAILKRVAEEKVPTDHQSSSPSPPPPPIPKRALIPLASRLEATAIEDPPIPPIRGNSVRNIKVEKEDAPPPPPLPPKPLPSLDTQETPPLPPKSPDIPMISGVLDQPKGLGYTYEPVKRSSKEGKPVEDKKATSWIYNTLKRNSDSSLLVSNGGTEDMNESGQLPASNVPAGKEGVEMGGVSVEPQRTNRVYEDIDGDGIGTALTEPNPEQEYEEMDIQVNANQDTATTTSGRPDQGTPNTGQLNKRANAHLEQDYEEMDDQLYTEMDPGVSTPSTGRPNQDTSTPSTGRPNQDTSTPITGHSNPGTSTGHPTPDMCTHPALKSPPGGKAQNYKKTNGVGKQGFMGSGRPNPPAARPAIVKPSSDPDYEDIDDMLEGVPVVTMTDTASKERDIGNAALYLENDEEVHDTDESKTSSMTVTLDLSHIVKDDIMYGSREFKTSTSVDISRLSNDESSEEAGGDGTVTPIEMTFNDSMFGMVKAKLDQQKRLAEGETGTSGHGEGDRLNDSAEYSSLPDEDESVFLNSNSSEPEEEQLPETEGAGHKRAKAWALSRTMDKRNAGSSEEVLEKYCVYVQQYMNTFIILLADSGIQHQHKVLNELWRLLAEQLISLDMIIEEKTKQAPVPSKVSTFVVSYSGYEHKCEAQPESAAYHFRHAVRRAHREYLCDPTLRQISLSKEHCRVLCQRVHEREIYFQPSKVSGDALSLHGQLERQAKLKRSLRQQPIVGPKIMFI